MHVSSSFTDIALVGLSAAGNAEEAAAEG
jgi:hypothetical protein